ncbi:hypothetical protein ACJ2A9_04175 [Anaerobacillus sp. MEB173]
MTKRKHFHNAAQKNNMTPTESMFNEEVASEIIPDDHKKGKKKRRS